MKNLLKKVIVLVIACACALGAFAGCGSYEDPVEEVDPNRRQIYVSMFNGGLGTEWLTKDVKAQYEAFDPEIQVIIDTNYRDAVLSEMSGLETDIFINNADSYDLFATSGNLANITSWIEEDVYDANYEYVGKENGTVSILDRIPEDFKDYYQFSTPGSYYVTPFYEGIFGIYYDADLFDAKQLYTYGSYGPDGVQGTLDDDLPANWNDFLDLLQLIKNESVTPFAFGNLDYIVKGFLNAVSAQHEGKKDFDLNRSFNGTDNTLGIINANAGTANFVELTKQEGRKAALTYANEIIKTANCTYESRAGQSHTEAGAQYVQSVQTGKRIAMFFEGNYWQNESRTTFNALEQIKDEWGYYKRNFRFMPIPKFDGTDDSGVLASDNVGKNTLYATGCESFIFVNNARVKNGADAETDVHTQDVKKFYQWLNSNKVCVTFSKHSGCFRTIDVKFSPTDLASCTSLTQNMYAYKYAETTEMCYALNLCKTRINQSETFQGFDFNSKLSNGTVTSSPFSFFKTNSGDIDNYFNGIYRYWTTVANFQVLG